LAREPWGATTSNHQAAEVIVLTDDEHQVQSSQPRVDLFDWAQPTLLDGNGHSQELAMHSRARPTLSGNLFTGVELKKVMLLADPPCFGKARSIARANHLNRNQQSHVPARATKHSLPQVLAPEDLDGEPSDIPH